MNKILLTSICAAAMTTAASAFTLTLTDGPLGTQVVTESGVSFLITGNGGSISGGVITTGANPVMVFYNSADATYVTSTLIGLGSSVGGSEGALQLTGQVSDISFEPTAVPEPSSTALLGLGGLALILRRRK
jgi:hypothetical protein